ncbi:MAG: VCBS repeat-containing protein [Proteobacteria bacterium]|nr:VCBS repeat-containing protein [Pseudomonadota bacterium]
MRGALGLLVGLALLAPPRLAGGAVLTEGWTTAAAGSPDGVALGDVDGDGRMEIAFILRGGTYTVEQSTSGEGSLVLLNHDGSLRWELKTGSELAGFPAFGDFDGDGLKDIAFCEVSPEAYCYVYNKDKQLIFSVGPYYFPAMTNGGPTVADLNGDGFADLAVPTWGGLVHASKGPSGASLWSYNLYAAHGDSILGHAAVADIDKDGRLEVVVGGAIQGGIFVINAENGTEQWSVPDLYSTYGNYFVNSGPVLVDLDGDGRLEVVASMSGSTSAAILAFSSTGAQLWRRPIAGVDFSFSSPSAADVTGDGKPNVIAQTLEGKLYQLAGSNGSIVRSLDFGSASWGTPAFLDIDGNGTYEVVASTLSKVVVLSGTFSELDRYDNANSAIFPAPVMGDIDGDGRLEMVTGTWFPPQLLAINLPYLGASWTAYGGSPSHKGSLGSNAQAALGNDPAIACIVVQHAIIDAFATTKDKDYSSARDDMDLAYREYLRGNPQLSIDRLRQALIHLLAGSGNPSLLIERTAYTGLMMFKQYIDRTGAVLGSSIAPITTALAALASSQSAFDAGSYRTAIERADNGALALRNYLDNNGPHTVVNDCPPPIAETFLFWECRINSVRDQTIALERQFPADNRLDNAIANLRTCLVWYPDLVFDSVYPACRSADGDLGAVTATNTTSLRQQLAFALMNNTRLFLDNVTVWFTALDPSALVTAETEFSAGLTAYNAGNYASAHQHFQSAYTSAKPCSGGSFAKNPQGLEGGGCNP